jgi:SNF family Na+-dependent transporter
MSVGTSAVILYGKYKKREEKILVDCFFIQLSNTLCGILSSFVIFIYIGHVAYTHGLEITQIPLSGPEVSFVVYPAALKDFFWPNIWSIIFFLNMFLLGVDS